MSARHHDAAANFRFLSLEVGSQLRLRWPIRQHHLIRLRGHNSARAGRPRKHFAGQDIFHRRNDVAGETLVEPANVTKIPRLEMRVRESPRSHLSDGPFGRGFVIRRPGQTRTINIRQHVLSLHELRIVSLFFANAFE